MEKTKIDWADSTWNPVTGCYHECEYCYARSMARRFSGITIKNGNGNIIVLDEPEISGAGKKMPYPYEFLPTFHKYRLGDYEKKKGRTIFVCSMADLFGKWVPDKWIETVFAACDKAPQHRYIFLTKYPERYIKYRIPLKDNYWYGTTITSDDDAGRFNYLPAFANTFVSIEPIMGDIAGKNNIIFSQVDWIIIGAETGQRKRKVAAKREWVEHIVEWSDKYGVPVFMKESLRDLMGADFRQEFPW